MEEEQEVTEEKEAIDGVLGENEDGTEAKEDEENVVVVVGVVEEAVLMRDLITFDDEEEEAVLGSEGAPRVCIPRFCILLINVSLYGRALRHLLGGQLCCC